MRARLRRGRGTRAPSARGAHELVRVRRHQREPGAVPAPRRALIALPPAGQIAALLPLALAAGLDLPLTLLLIGAAPELGFQSTPPGELADLSARPVLVMAAVLWILEVWAERRPVSALSWNLVQGVVRPLAGGLLALLLIPDAEAPVRWAAAAVSAGVALWTQAGRTGWRLLLDLARARHPSRAVVSAAEDAAALALVALLLDAPIAATVLALVTMALGAAWARPSVRAYRFGLRLIWGGTWGVLAPRRWSEPSRFPGWVTRALSSDAMAPGGWLRGAPVGALAHPDLDVFQAGWVVVRGGRPLFVFRRGGGTRSVELSSPGTVRVVQDQIHNRVELLDPQGRTYALCFPWDGPRAEGLEAEFLV
ncbi:MAG: DUF4126 family protein [Gemmatimonadetes bacterium]|nr:DUF4126 family protein [Gemmatimonadota bacterium]